MSNYESSLAQISNYRKLNSGYYELLQKTEATGNSKLLALISNLLDARTLDERWQLLKICLADFGADQLSYGLFDAFTDDRTCAPMGILSTIEESWIKNYSTERLDLIDPHLAMVREHAVPNYLWGESGIRMFEESETRAILQETRSIGVTACIHLTLTDSWMPEKPAGVMAIGSSLGEDEFYRCALPHYGPITAAAQVFHMLAIGEMRSRESGYANLTPRERECLKYTTEGLRINGVADKLNLKRVTVDMHLRNARRKLGAKTLPEAVAKALMINGLKLNQRKTAP